MGVVDDLLFIPIYMEELLLTKYNVNIIELKALFE